MERFTQIRALFLMIIFTSLPVQAASWIVCPQCEVKTIKQAVLQAQAGDVISISPGIYHETEIVIEKSLTLQGTGNPRVNAGGNGTVFRIRASDVTISGISIENSGYSYIEDLAGIKVEKADRCKILNNQLKDCFFAIHIGDSQACTIENNLIIGPKRAESASGNGIHVWHGQNIIIQGNHVTGHRDGIYFEFVKDSKIIENQSEGNLRYGLHFMYSDGDEYVRNVFRKNSSGVAVMYSKRIKMQGNRFEESWGGAAYGILLKEISQSRVERNYFIGNTVGAYLEGTTRSSFKENDFQSNGWALRVLGDSDTNRFIHNNFFSNTFDVSTNSSSNQNEFTENYWSDYAGIDLNQDGIGDTPFHPVRLSSVLMEKFGVSVLLLKSFFFTIADEAEAALPVLTPDALRDNRPLMGKWVLR